jgi:hypothetical protein
MMQLVREVPLNVTASHIHLGGWKPQEVHAFFERFEMNAMRSRYDRLRPGGPPRPD